MNYSLGMISDRLVEWVSDRLNRIKQRVGAGVGDLGSATELRGAFLYVYYRLVKSVLKYANDTKSFGADTK